MRQKPTHTLTIFVKNSLVLPHLNYAGILVETIAIIPKSLCKEDCNGESDIS